MNLLNPIFTEKRECQDCYKCVRHCPVKAIKIEHGCATVMPELCVYCGNCVLVCPSGAKKVRDDLPRTRHLLATRARVVASLAPSYVSAFPGIRSGQMVAALKRLRFDSVSETALGAQEVSAHVARLLQDHRGDAMISSACPTVVLYLRKHRQEQSKLLTPLLSPMLAHAKMLRTCFGDGVGIVFIGPCIAKKVEADEHPELLDAALTFEDLARWFEQEGIDPASMNEGPGDQFIPERARDGAIYAADGGMIAGVRANCAVNDSAFMCFSGLSSIQKALPGVENLQIDQSILLELLACEGGCINGPCVGRAASTTQKRYELLRSANYEPASVPRTPALTIDLAIRPTPREELAVTEAQIRQALRIVGKVSADDELNCGGCGYESCREFGKALIANKAERSMCVTYMRQLAHKKANALIQKMPAAVVIVDQNLKIVEYNAAFHKLVANGSRVADDTGTRLEDAQLATLFPFHKLFAQVLRSGEEVLDKDFRYRDTILHLSIFTIEKNVLVGAIIQDITKPAVQKEQVITKAQEVIKRNLETVQQIAYLLGENASESEITLHSIIDSFSLPTAERADEGPDDDWRKRYRR